MIDFEKEKEAFEIHLNYMTDRVSSAPFYMENGSYMSSIINSMWSIWKKRAELAQAEITELKQKVEKLEIENKTMEHNNVWLNKQYAELESKLTDYENPNYVLVPRTPNKKMLKEMESGYYFEQGWSHYFGEEAYDRMLKAVEKQNAQQDS